MKLKKTALSIMIPVAILTASQASAYGYIGTDTLHCYQRPDHIKIDFRVNNNGDPDCYAYNRNSGQAASLVNTIYYNPVPSHGLPQRCVTVIQANPGCKNVGQYLIDSMTRYRGTDSTTQY